MKKMTMVLMTLIFASGICLAAEQTKDLKQPVKPPMAEAHQIASGTIDSIIPADLEKKTKAKLALKQENGSVEKFVLGKAAIFDINAKHLELSQLKSGEKAKIQFITSKDGVKEAQIVTLVK